MNNYFTFNTSEKKYLNEINKTFDEGLSPYAAKKQFGYKKEDAPL